MLYYRGIKTYSNLAALAELRSRAAATPAGTALVEVGVFRGGSLLTMAEATGNPIFGVDTWGLEGAYASRSESPAKYGLDNMKIAAEAVNGMAHVSLWREFSTVAAQQYAGPPVSLLYIDGEHTYEAAIADFTAWQGHLTAESVVCFDDCDAAHRGVREAVLHLAEHSGFTLDRIHGDRLAVLYR